jgi:predicted transcriptional regulator
MTTTENPAARKGLLKYLHKQGGSSHITDLHTFSTMRFGAGHQAFSQLMEGLVGEELVSYDGTTFHLTDKGRDLCKTMLL